MRHHTQVTQPIANSSSTMDDVSFQTRFDWRIRTPTSPRNLKIFNIEHCLRHQCINGVEFPVYHVSFSVSGIFVPPKTSEFLFSIFSCHPSNRIFALASSPIANDLTMSNSNLTHSNGHGTGYGNITLLMNPELCTLETCDLSMASFLYLPTLPGNAIYAAIFGIYIVTQLFLGIKHKTWGYMVAMVLGLLLEVIGYVARIMLHNSPFDNNNFLMYLVTLTIAPALLSASVSLVPACC
jgi:hypothetical protein